MCESYTHVVKDIFISLIFAKLQLARIADFKFGGSRAGSPGVGCNSPSPRAHAFGTDHGG